MTTEVPAWVTLAGLDLDYKESKTEELKSASVEEQEIPAWVILNEYPY